VNYPTKIKAYTYGVEDLILAAGAGAAAVGGRVEVGNPLFFGLILNTGVCIYAYLDSR